MDKIDSFIRSLLKQDELPTPSGWIQYKGTDLCMDIRCDCGELHHIDGEFIYFIKCPCGNVYAVGQSVRLYKMNEEQIKAIDEERIKLVNADV